MLRDEDNLGLGGTRANWVMLRIVLRIYRVHRRIQPTVVAALRELEEERGETGLEQLIMDVPSATGVAVRGLGRNPTHCFGARLDPAGAA